jgi:uncharacterized membrane protein YcaP (DUF421 family)
MWFTGWEPIGRAIVFSTIGYVSLITFVRLLGARTISKMNPGDFIVTVALGSVTASFIVHGDISLTQGLAAMTTLLGLQFVTERMTSRFQKLRQVADGQPVLLAYHGRLLHDAMRRENIHDEDIFAAAREHGIGRLADLHAVVLEIDGQFSVIAAKDAGDDMLKDVRRASSGSDFRTHSVSTLNNG